VLQCRVSSLANTAMPGRLSIADAALMSGLRQERPPFAAFGWPLLAVLMVLGAVLPLAVGLPYLAVFPAIALFGLIALAVRPKWFVYGIVFLMPMGSIRHLGGPLAGIQIHWLLAGGLLVAFAGYILINPALAKRLRANIWPAYFLFLVISLLAVLSSPYKGEVLSEAVLVLVGMIFVALIMVFLDRDAIRVGLPRIIVAAVSLGSVVAILEYYLGIYIVGSADTTGYRAEGLTGDPNGFALNLLFVFPFLAYQLTAAPDMGRKLLSALLLVVNLAAMVATMSRSGALLLAMLLPTLFLASSVRLRPRSLGFIFLGLMLVVGAVAVSVPDEFWERQQTLVAGERDNAMSRRGAYVVVAGRAFVESPILGHGLGAFKYIFSKTPEAAQYDKGNSSDRVRDAHNTYLEVLVGLGLLGLGAFLALLGIAIRNFFVAYKVLTDIGDDLGARLALHYLIAFVTLLSYLTFFSDVHHKFVLLMLAASVLWLRDSRETRARLTNGEQRLKAKAV